MSRSGERSVRIREVKGSNPSRSTIKKAVKSLISRLFCVFGRFQFLPEKCRTVAFAPRIIRIHLTRRKSENSGENRRFSEKRFLRANNAILGETEPFASKRIRKVGTITPALARPLPDGGYELISGHRRLAACQVLGIETMPVIVREMSDDEAVIAMVDANLQRETILPSEKAFAYKMKLDAIKHQGVTSRQLGEKLLSITQVSKDSDDSERQIQRYIRLTCLIPELLSMVDDKKIAFNPAVEISYLDRDEQLTLLDAINMNDCTPSHAQSIRLKKMSQDGLLTADAIYAILSEEKPNQKEQIKLPRDELRKYFPQNYSDKQIKRDILKGLELLKRQRERNRDAR